MVTLVQELLKVLEGLLLKVLQTVDVALSAKVVTIVTLQIRLVVTAEAVAGMAVVDQTVVMVEQAAAQVTLVLLT